MAKNLIFADMLCTNPKISVIGYGSWATALVGLITSNGNKVNWHIRNSDILESVNNEGINPKYLSELELDKNLIYATPDINEAVTGSDIILLAAPSAFLKNFMEGLSVPINDKYIVSAIKGIVPEENLTVTEYIHNTYSVPFSRIALISGPTHAEEVSRGKLTYINVVCTDKDDANVIENVISSKHLVINYSSDIYGIEYTGILKNIYAIVAGIATGLGYGDNTLAVLVCHCAEEMQAFINSTMPESRCATSYSYLGDLLVTSYSTYSRNRRLGQLIGKGCTVKSALNEMTMVAEGYFAVKGLRVINEKHQIPMPIADAIYRILYEGANPRKTIAQLLFSF